MKSVHKSVLLWYSAEEMFALVTAVAQYPQFLPWCDHAAVLSHDDAGMMAQIGIAYAGVRQRFTTRNEHVPGRQVTIALVDGPFSQLNGRWDFTPLGEGQRASRVELQLHYGFGSSALAALVGPVFDRVAANLMEAFVKRADKVYG